MLGKVDSTLFFIYFFTFRKLVETQVENKSDVSVWLRNCEQVGIKAVRPRLSWHRSNNPLQQAFQGCKVNPTFFENLKMPLSKWGHPFVENRRTWESNPLPQTGKAASIWSLRLQNLPGTAR